MKTNFSLIIVCLTLAGFSSCGNEKKQDDITINYIFLCDTMGPGEIAGFKHFLTDPWKAGDDPLSSSQPDDFEKIELTVYDLSTGSAPQPVTVKFEKKNDDNQARLDTTDSFLNQLASLRSKEKNTKNILRALNHVLLGASDLKMNYQLVFYSQMVENSGGAAKDKADNDNWINGQFRFLNLDKNCITTELDEAKAQADSNRGWINKNLFKIGDLNSNLSKIKLHCTIFQRPVVIVSNRQFPYGATDILNFWSVLLRKLHVDTQYAQSEFGKGTLAELAEKM